MSMNPISSNGSTFGQTYDMFYSNQVTQRQKFGGRPKTAQPLNKPSSKQRIPLNMQSQAFLQFQQIGSSSPDMTGVKNIIINEPSESNFGIAHRKS